MLRRRLTDRLGGQSSSSSASGGTQLEHGAGGEEHEQLAVAVLPEGLHLLDAEVPAALVDDVGDVHLDGPHVGRAVVGVEVRALEVGDGGAAVLEAPGDGAPVVVGVLVDRQDRAGRVAPLELVAALHAVPAEVRAAARVEASDGGESVDLLPLALADVGDPQVTGQRVEREPPRVADAVEPHLGGAVLAVGEGVAGGDRVGVVVVASLRVDAQDLAEQLVRVLSVAVGVSGTAAVAEADVQVAVGPEDQVPAVVVGRRLLDLEELPARIQVDGRCGRRARTRAPRCARRAGR